MGWLAVTLLAPLLGSGLLGSVSAHKILLVSTLPSHSHSLWFNKLAQVLAQRGHQIVIVDTDPPRKSFPNVTHYFLDNVYDFGGAFQDLEALASQSSTTDCLILSYAHNYDSCKTMGASKSLATFLQKERGFDLAVLDYWCESFLRLVPAVGGAKMMMATAFSDPSVVLEVAGHYDNPAYVPVLMSPHMPNMNFKERVMNTVYYLMDYGLRQWCSREQERLAVELFGAGPTLASIKESVNVVLVNTQPALTGSKPLPPNVVPVAGFHIDPVKPLPKDIKAFLDGATDGAVFFSLGSNILSKDMSEEKRAVFLEAMKRLPYRILWKWEDDKVPDLPPNVLVSKWLPQNDILGHKNVVCFLTHGGLLSSQEAVYHGVPLVGIPFIVDQFQNMASMERRGLAIKLSYTNITADQLFSAITTVVTDASYRERLRVGSAVMRDRPVPARELAVYWVEYVLRHDGAPHLKPPPLPTHQLLLLDVAALLALLLLAPPLLLCLLLRRLCRSAPKQKQKVKTK